jgi:hypothetical protein
VQAPGQAQINSFACVKFEPDGDSKNMAALDNYSMRRTAWDCFWLDRNELNLDGIDFHTIDADTPAADKMDGVETSKEDSSEERAKDFIRRKRRTMGTTLKIWVRRTIIYQLVNVGVGDSPSRYYGHSGND